MAAKPRKKKEPTLSKEAALEIVRRLMRSTGFDEEGQEGDRIHFGSREGGDMEEDRADPALVRFALTRAKEIEAAVPGSKVRVEPVDEWVTIDVTLPSEAAKATKPPKPPKPPKAAIISPAAPPAPQQRRYLKPGDEVDYTNFTIGGSFKGTAIVSWDHGKYVEARTLGGERLHLERAADGSLRRFT
jgi:hypothetical protein